MLISLEKLYVLEDPSWNSQVPLQLSELDFKVLKSEIDSTKRRGTSCVAGILLVV